MCQSLAEGGQRCANHLKKEITRLTVLERNNFKEALKADIIYSGDPQFEALKNKTDKVIEDKISAEDNNLKNARDEHARVIHQVSTAEEMLKKADGKFAKPPFSLKESLGLGKRGHLEVKKEIEDNLSPQAGEKEISPESHKLKVGYAIRQFNIINAANREIKYLQNNRITPSKDLTYNEQKRAVEIRLAYVERQKITAQNNYNQLSFDKNKQKVAEELMKKNQPQESFYALALENKKILSNTAAKKVRGIENRLSFLHSDNDEYIDHLESQDIAKQVIQENPQKVKEFRDKKYWKQPQALQIRSELRQAKEELKLTRSYRTDLAKTIEKRKQEGNTKEAKLLQTQLDTLNSAAQAKKDRQKEVQKMVENSRKLRETSESLARQADELSKASSLNARPPKVLA